MKTAIDEKDLSLMQRTIHSMRPQLMHSGFHRFNEDFIILENAETWNGGLEVKLHAIVHSIEEKLKEYRNNAHS